MIGLLIGKIFSAFKNPIIIMAGNVGYEVYVSPRFLSTLTIGKDVTIFTYTHVREDTLELFGFSTQEEIDIFHLLITVSGIGPKTALLVTDRGAQAVKNAIIKSDVDFFTTIPRLGKKNAQKIIIELKNKLGSLNDLDLSSDTSGITADLVEALTGMGFARSEVINAIKKIEFNDETIEQRIRITLKFLGKKI